MNKIAVLALALLVTVLVARCGQCQEKSSPTATTTQVTKDVIPKKWLKKKTTVEKAEQAHLVTDGRLGPKPIPFGFINARWEKLKEPCVLGTNCGSLSPLVNHGRISQAEPDSAL